MGPPGTSTMHANAASSDATTNPGPGSGQVSIIATNYGAVFPTIMMGSDGLIVAVATKIENRTPYVYLLNPTNLNTLAPPLELIRSTTSELAGGIYSYLDNSNCLVLVNAHGYLQRISHTQASNGSWTLSTNSSVQIGYPDVVGLVPDYQGRVWFATAQGSSTNSGAVVGYYDPTTTNTAAFTLPNGEQIANSISSSPAGVAVASTAALYLFQAGTNDVPVQLWRQSYTNGPGRKPGQLSWGTGATPSFFGPATGYEYLTITDNAAPQENILVFQTGSGTPVGSVPLLTAGVNSGNEDAAIAVGNSIYYPSTYGYPYPKSAENPTNSVPESAPFVGGMQRVDVLTNGTLQTIWTNNTTASAAEPRMSVRDNLIYTVSVDTNTSTYSFITIDPGTGAVLSSTPYGTGWQNNPLQMVSMISPDGVLYQGTESGLIRVQAVPLSSTYAGSFPGLAPNGVGSDGLPYLIKYFHGGTNTNSSVTLPTVEMQADRLILTAVVRTNDTNLLWEVQFTTNLASGWTQLTNNPQGILSSHIHGTVPTGCQLRDFAVPQGSDPKKFLRLKVTQP